MSENYWANSTVQQLKKILRARGLPVSGRKQELLKRLQQDDGEMDEDEITSLPDLDGTDIDDDLDNDPLDDTDSDSSEEDFPGIISGGKAEETQARIDSNTSFFKDIAPDQDTDTESENEDEIKEEPTYHQRDPLASVDPLDRNVKVHQWIEQTTGLKLSSLTESNLSGVNRPVSPSSSTSSSTLPDPRLFHVDSIESKQTCGTHQDNKSDSTPVKHSIIKTQEDDRNDQFRFSTLLESDDELNLPDIQVHKRHSAPEKNQQSSDAGRSVVQYRNIFDVVKIEPMENAHASHQCMESVDNILEPSRSTEALSNIKYSEQDPSNVQSKASTLDEINIKKKKVPTATLR